MNLCHVCIVSDSGMGDGNAAYPTGNYGGVGYPTQPSLYPGQPYAPVGPVSAPQAPYPATGYPSYPSEKPPPYNPNYPM